LGVDNLIAKNSIPTPALPVSGSEGVISARCIKAPLSRQN